MVNNPGVPAPVLAKSRPVAGVGVLPLRLALLKLAGKPVSIVPSEKIPSCAALPLVLSHMVNWGSE